MIYYVREDKRKECIFKFTEINEVNINKAKRLLKLFPNYKIFSELGVENSIEKLESLIVKETILYDNTNTKEEIKEEPKKEIPRPKNKSRVTTRVTKRKEVIRGEDNTIKKGDIVVTLQENIIRRKPYLDSGSIPVKEFGNININILKTIKPCALCRSKKGVIFPVLDVYKDDISTWVKCGTKGWMCVRYKEEEFCAKYK